ncbi:signal peptidase, endoplasmic reticulum-type [Sporobacter termitidis DSM 10068]|uniref:Signal peptidase I n=1 Tax=Sporobacter termitidis DSM 10068 TaxID=1123282 RepID=A0A1M5Y4D0_9FIRM|nr:signal peptidase I [Sporobacter termitidis]SHI06930.1 signal peptidase, endoplasmic reticulum-type [Sporobacter termitidis DSM 10068]
MKVRLQRLFKALLLYLPAGLLGLLLLINVILGLEKAVTRAPVPSLFGFAPLVVMSGSMEPAIYPGDVVVIRREAPSAYKAGDVATYLAGQTAYTHRIVALGNGTVTMKGDANNAADDTVPAGKLVGKVLLVIPKLGYLIVFLKKPAGMALLTLALLLCVYSGALLRRLGKAKRLKRGGGC